MATRKITAKVIAQARASHTGRDGDLFFDDSSNQFFISDGSTAGGVPLALNQKVNVVASTAATLAPTVAQSGSIFTINAAAGCVVTLPAATAGLNYGFHLGTTVTSKINPPLKDFLKKHSKKCKIVSFINDQDIVPRLSLENGVILLAVCASIANEIFLNQDNKEIFREELKKAKIYTALNTIIQSGKLKDKALKEILRTRHRLEVVQQIFGEQLNLLEIKPRNDILQVKC